MEFFFYSNMNQKGINSWTYWNRMVINFLDHHHTLVKKLVYHNDFESNALGSLVSCRPPKADIKVNSQVSLLVLLV